MGEFKFIHGSELVNWKPQDKTFRDYGEEGIKYKYVRYDKKYKLISINMDIPNKGARYEVDLERCTTAGECLDWIHQLHEKNWFHAEMEKEFIDLLFRVIPDKLWR